jgi:hypothetical protein
MDERLNVGRFLAAGAVTGLLINVFDGILYAGLLAADRAEIMAETAMEPPSTAGMMVFVALAFLMGFAAIWLYVGVRARLGPGHVTAAKVGLAVWLFAYFVPFLANTLQGLATPRMYWVGVAFTIVAVPLATIAGARVYQRGEPATDPTPAQHAS